MTGRIETQSCLGERDVPTVAVRARSAPHPGFAGREGDFEGVEPTLILEAVGWGNPGFLHVP